MKFVYNYITTIHTGRPKKYPVRPMTTTRQYAAYIAKFFFALYRSHGIIVVVRQGWALGAFREGGAIGNDGDADVFLIMPANCSLNELLVIIKSHIGDWNRMNNELRIELTYYPILKLFYESYLELNVDCWFKDKRVFSSDVNILHEKSIFLDKQYNLFCHKRHGFCPKDMFRSLQECAFEDTQLFCYTNDIMKKYLAYLYGNDYMIPQTKCGKEINFRNRRPFWRSGIGNYFFNIFNDYNILFDIFVRRRFPRFEKD